MAKPIVVEDSDLDWLVKVTRQTSGAHTLRNVALIYTLFGTGLTPSEIARLAVADYLNADGSVREESAVRAEIAFNKRERALYWINPKLVKAMEAYMQERLALGLGRGPHSTFRGLSTDSPLFLGRGSDGFSFREIEKGGKTYFQCASLSNLYSKLMKQAGLEGATAASGRRTMAVKLNRQGAHVRTINEVLGQVSLTATKRMVEGDPVRLGRLVEGII